MGWAGGGLARGVPKALSEGGPPHPHPPEPVRQGPTRLPGRFSCQECLGRDHGELACARRCLSSRGIQG